MKKLAVLLAIAVMLTLCACANTQPEATEPSQTETQGTVATDATVPTDATNATNATDATDPTDATVGTTDATEGDPAPTNATETIVTQTDPTRPESCHHDFTKPTCTAPMTCTKCGATEGKPAPHNYIPATCTAPRTCSECGATEGEKTPHRWQSATCTAPATCKTCGATEGSTIDHNYADGLCTKCGAAAPKSAYDEFIGGVWKCEVVKPATADICETYFVVYYDPGMGFGYSYKSYFSELSPGEDGEEQQYFGTVEYNGKTYYDLTFSGSMGGWELTELDNGNVKIEMMNEVTLEIKRDAPGKFSIVSINDPDFLPVGAVLNKTRDVAK